MFSGRNGFSGPKATPSGACILSLMQYFDVCRVQGIVSGLRSKKTAQEWAIVAELRIICQAVSLVSQSRPVIQLRAAPNRRWSGVQEPYHLDEHNRECLAIGLVTLAFRSLNSLMRPFAQMPRGFCRLVMSGGGAGYRTH
jgi:hypothetical protein